MSALLCSICLGKIGEHRYHLRALERLPITAKTVPEYPLGRLPLKKISSTTVDIVQLASNVDRRQCGCCKVEVTSYNLACSRRHHVHKELLQYKIVLPIRETGKVIKILNS